VVMFHAANLTNEGRTKTVQCVEMRNLFS
jgi:hypothetical protein